MCVCVREEKRKKERKSKTNPSLLFHALGYAPLGTRSIAFVNMFAYL